MDLGFASSVRKRAHLEAPEGVSYISFVQGCGQVKLSEFCFFPFLFFFPSTVSSFFLFDFFLYCYKKKQIICIYVFIYVNIYVCIKVLNLHFEPPAPCERFHDIEQ